MKVQFKKEIDQVAHRQDYNPKPTIEGVNILPLRRFNDDGGSFTELTRLDNGISQEIKGFSLAQVNFSEMDPQSVKAFHVHRQQTDIWFVPPGSKVLLVLVDLRTDSPSNGKLMRLIIGDGNSKLVVIPPGVAHGCKNLGCGKAQLIYFMDKQFSAQADQCDEWRLPWDHFGADLWEVQKG
ncbi:MAG: dTDP-4-dehydrorhamnose 3,5-epimerase family protein [Candidatus Neomarinimicrobiota bacterium]